MPKKLTIILGAGASHGSVQDRITSNNPIVPPITKDIFSTDFDFISNKYEDVKSATVGITHEVKDGKSLEDFIKDNIGSLDRYKSLQSHRKRQFNQLPLYLQDLFSYISGQLKISTHYSKFVNFIFDKDIHTTYITLNYDLLLESAIEKVEEKKFSRFDDYITEKRSLFKLHGSVNWFRAINKYEQTGNNLESWKAIVKNINLYEDLDTKIQLINLDSFREGFIENSPYYPVLAIPNSVYDLIFPDQTHKPILEEKLQNSDNFLIIGFSGYDQDMLDLLKNNVTRVNKYLIVSNTQPDIVYEELTKNVPIFKVERPADVQYGGGFAKFLSGGIDLNNFLNSI